MAELTKADNRQPIGKIKPTDKMVMMQSLCQNNSMRDLICTSISKLKVVT